MDHVALVKLGVRWMREQGCRVVIAEPNCSVNGESPDVIGWTQRGLSIVIEAKSNWVDFRDDWRPDRKTFRREAEQGMGVCRYYLCPPGIIDADDVEPRGWGLMHAYPGRIFKVVGAPHQKRNAEAELCLLTRVVRNEDVEPTNQLKLPGVWNAR